MGFTPAEVEAMSLWQYRATADGWMAAHAAGDEIGLDGDDIADLTAALDAAA